MAHASVILATRRMLTKAERRICEDAARAAHKLGRHEFQAVQGCPTCRMRRKCMKKYQGGEK